MSDRAGGDQETLVREALQQELEATHDWIREFVGDHAYAHGLADDVFTLKADLVALRQERDEALAIATDANDKVEFFIDRADEAVRSADAAKEALRLVLDCKGSYEGRVSTHGGDPAICPSCADVARAVLAASPPADSEAETVFAWLIERGQSEKQSPTMWWIGEPDALSRHGETWTQDAWQATRFTTEAAAHAVVDRLFRSPGSGDYSARAVEHGFVPRAAVSGGHTPAETEET
jgi:hypothetical protein